jgi:D-alanyl-D-alanine carboxypeptidase (penicillin-binding protein 5/6)
VLVLVAAALVRRIATERTPPLSMRRTLAAFVRVPGSVPALAWPSEGQAAVAVDGVGGFGASGESGPVPIASLAKMMTAYLTLREHPLTGAAPGFVMRITAAQVAEQGQRVSLDESTVPVRTGERLSERQALEALMLPSANNIAVLLAAHDAGSTAAFVARMNATAHALGMRSTVYTDPSGFNASTVSTATDQLRLARVAMRVPAFAQIVDEPTVVLPVAGRVANYNGLLGTDGYVGVKTGSDDAAGGCLAFAKRVSLDGRRLTVLGVVLGQRQGPLVEAALASARRLGDSAAAALRWETVLPAGTSVLRASNTGGEQTTGRTASAVHEIGWAGLELRVQVEMRVNLKRLSEGERMATVTLTGVHGASIGALAARALSGPSLGWRLRHVL